MSTFNPVYLYLEPTYHGYVSNENSSKIKQGDDIRVFIYNPITLDLDAVFEGKIDETINSEEHLTSCYIFNPIIENKATMTF